LAAAVTDIAKRSLSADASAKEALDRVAWAYNVFHREPAMTLNPPPMPSELAAATARRLREEAKRADLILDKTRPAREAAEAERRKRAEAHRLAALPELAERLAGVVFDEIERQGRILVRAQLADALHAALLRSGLARDPRSAPPPDPSRC
jgi:hypothetical protein